MPMQLQNSVDADASLLLDTEEGPDKNEEHHQSLSDGEEKRVGGKSTFSSSTTPPSDTERADPDIEAAPYNRPPTTSVAESSSESSQQIQKELSAPESESGTPADGNQACELSTVVIASVDVLPSLPKPRHDILREETPRGICAVMTCIVLCIFLTHYIALTLVLPSDKFDLDNDETDDKFEGNPYVTGKIVLLAFVYTESVVALLCTAGILCANPCVVQRSLDACNPLPKAVEHWVVSEPTSPRPKGLDLYLRGSDNQLYCTKCLVWRNPGITHYHCGICQRCCAYHDHHCNVFGRCIAGNPRFWEPKSKSGNLLYFYGILASGGWGFVTTFSAFLYAFSIRYRPVYAIPIGILVMLVISCCCFGNGPIHIVCWPLSRIWRCARSYLCRRKRR